MSSSKSSSKSASPNISRTSSPRGMSSSSSGDQQKRASTGSHGSNHFQDEMKEVIVDDNPLTDAELSVLNSTKTKSELARDAFSTQDSEASKLVHKLGAASKEKHKSFVNIGPQILPKYLNLFWHTGKTCAKLTKKLILFSCDSGGAYIKSGVFGGVDGIVTTFSTIASLAAAKMDPRAILILGFANLVADGVAMGLGDYISEKSEYNFAQSEQDRERWEYDNFLEGELEEMVEIYKSKGMDEADAKRVVELLSSDKNHFTDVMMAEELGMMPPDESESQLLMGVATFLSFLIFGTIPLLPYIISVGGKLSINTQILFNNDFIACIPVTLVTLFILGAVSSIFTTGKWIKEGLYLVVVGGIASACAFLIAYGLSKAVNIPPGVV